MSTRYVTQILRHKQESNPVYAQGMAVIINRMYSPRHLWPHITGTMSTQMAWFPGIRVGEPLYLGNGVFTTPVVSVECLLTCTVLKVYRCETVSGSVYEVNARPQR